MTDVLGLTVKDALAALESSNMMKPVQMIETSGYKATENMEDYADVRVVGIRESEQEITLIIARF